MRYFVTGATGFIGRRLVQALLARRGSTVWVLVRPGREDRLEPLRKAWGVPSRRVVAVQGDITRRGLGLRPEVLRSLVGRVDAVYHLAGLMDITAEAAALRRVNVTGTRHVVDFAAAVGAGHLHHVSSVAVAGRYDGVFREDMFEQAGELDPPYLRSKHEAEAIVRRRCQVPWTVYRPGLVVGDSASGEMDRADGPAYLFKLIQRLRQSIPPWLPGVGLEGGHLNLVPVDYVARVIDHVSHSRRPIAGRAFHVVDPRGHRVSELFELFSLAAHAPRPGLWIHAGWWSRVPRQARLGLSSLPPLRRLADLLLQDLGLPTGVLGFLDWPTRYDRSGLDELLQGSGIECPDLATYAWRLWDHWERHLDPELAIDRSLRGAVGGRVVLVTGGSSGIGLATALRMAQAGAVTLICGRDESRLQQACAMAQAQGLELHAYQADLSTAQDAEGLVKMVLAEHGRVDVLINNAGRSIRRSIENSTDRFHDFERTVQLNYFGSLRVTLGLLPGMASRGSGHVVHISSIGVITNAPRFSAYVASKAAMDAWMRCAASEYADRGITFTTVHMPLVRTPMIEPTPLYRHVPMLSADEAADLVVRACVDKPVRLSTGLGTLGELLQVLTPRLAQLALNTSFRLFPESAAARGAGSPAAPPDEADGAPARDRPELSAEALALLQVLRGIHL